MSIRAGSVRKKESEKIPYIDIVWVPRPVMKDSITHSTDDMDVSPQCDIMRRPASRASSIVSKRTPTTPEQRGNKENGLVSASPRHFGPVRSIQPHEHDKDKDIPVPKTIQKDILHLNEKLNSEKPNEENEKKETTIEQLAELCRTTIQKEKTRAGDNIFRLESLRQLGMDIVISIAESIDDLYDKTFSMLQQKNNYRCEYCHRTCDTLKKLRIGNGKLTQDHIIPKSLGGTRTNANIAYVCQECNALKGNMLPWEWIRRLLTQPGPNKELSLLRAVNVGLVTELMLHKLGIIKKVSESFKYRLDPEKFNELEKLAIQRLVNLQQSQAQAQAKAQKKQKNKSSGTQNNQTSRAQQTGQKRQKQQVPDTNTSNKKGKSS